MLDQNDSVLQKCEKSKSDAFVESLTELEKKPETTCSDEPIKEAFDNKELLVKVDTTVDFWAMTNDFNTRDVKADVNEIGIVVNGNPNKIDPLNVSPRSKGAMEQKQSLKTHEDVKPKATRRNANTRIQIEVAGPGYSFREKYEYMSIYVNMMKNVGMKYGAEDHKQFLERSRKITEIIQSIDEEDCVKLIFLAGLTDKETEICLNSNVNNVNAWVDMLCDQTHCFESPLTPGDDLKLELEYDSRSDKAFSLDSSTGKQSDSRVSIRTKQIPRRKQTFQIRDEFQPTSRRDQPTQRPNIVASMVPSSIDPLINASVQATSEGILKRNHSLESKVPIKSKIMKEAIQMNQPTCDAFDFPASHVEDLDRGMKGDVFIPEKDPLEECLDLNRKY